MLLDVCCCTTAAAAVVSCSGWLLHSCGGGPAAIRQQSLTFAILGLVAAAAFLMLGAVAAAAFVGSVCDARWWQRLSRYSGRWFILGGGSGGGGVRWRSRYSG